MSAFQKKLLGILVVLAVVSPLGIYLPAKFQANDAWGEWSADTVEKLIGFIPEGLKRDADLWKAPVAEYNLGDEKAPAAVRAFSYILSALIGIILCMVLLYGLSKLLAKK